jgi:tetratricopeptide (TPR) repeat protein
MMTKPYLMLLLAALLPSAQYAAADTAQANAALQHGRVDEAEKSLRAALRENPNAPQAHQLLCRVFYAQDQADPAIPECEAAVAEAPNDSENQLWLGRAYGLKASHANPLSAFALARKVRTSFERACQAAPVNLEAAISLGQFYVAAPAVVGGGIDKAKRLAASLQAQSPAKAHRLLALVADSAKDARTAEAEYKSAVAVSMSPDAYMDLGLFYQAHNQPDQALSAIRAGIAADWNHGPALVDAASILLDAHRAPDLAERALRDYLASPNQSDSAPVFKVHLQLGKLLAPSPRTSRRPAMR